MNSQPADRPDLSRRRFLQLTAGGVGVTLLLEACAPAPAAPKPTAASAAAGASGPLPTYIPPTGGPKPDLQSADPRISIGYLNYPKEPPKAWTGGAPGTGGTLNVLMAGYYPPPAPRDVNATWKAVEKELNTSVLMTIIPGADYRARLQVVMAGSDMPDIIHVSGPVNDLIASQFLQAQMADLTPYLAGDAAKDYPNLAAVPGYAWKGSGGVFDNRLYGVPIHRYLPAFWFFKNSTIWDAEIGATTVPKDADDFKKILQQLNRPQENRYAFGNSGPVAANMWGLSGFLEMFGAPNLWAQDSSGKLTRSFETEQYKAAVGYMRDLVSSGLYHPDAQTLTGTQGRDAFIAGKFVVSNEAFGNGWNDFWRRGVQQNPPRQYTIVPPFSSTAGVPPRHFISGGTIAYNIIKKGSADRVKEVLRIMDYLAAPFGTQEDTLLTYGLRDQDFTVDGSGNPAPTQPGIANSQYVPWQYISHRPYVWYQADLPGYSQAAFEVEQTLVNIGVGDPTRGLHSTTQSRRGVAADQTFYEGVADILFNRRQLSEYDGLVADWRNAAGDAIRKEFQDEIAASK